SPPLSPTPESISGSVSSSAITGYSTEPLVSFRYEHAQDDNGNHVVIGREGELQCCEDEPIRTPGAIQAFGVLIAVEDLEDTLVVRQVSENSTELLGLSPRFLFSLECFTDTLPDAQAGVLWDNIQYLSRPGPNEEEEIESPHVFLLSGWGAPGSSPLGPGDGRHPWTCWCAVHRPVTGTGQPLTGPSLIVMEFELERDILNPLYPPVVSQKAPATSTLISSTSDGFITDKNILNLDVDFSCQTQVTSNSDTPAESTSTLLTVPANHITPQPFGGLDGPQDWSPSAEKILESTTSRAKPLPALERLRRITNIGVTLVADSTDPLTSPAEPKSRRKRHRAGKENSGVGMMDVFAVMGQINEQLGAASTLDEFLKVVVGVIQDLTQFHRVLVYQFDESWNGQVVAELVDWSQTRDLYKGLHFPATDIPAQARALYAINKVRLLYDRSQSTARIVVRSKEDIDTPLNMTHCYLRAMSPIHIKYLANMGVRASMSVSIMAFGTLWGLVTCHSYGTHGMRVSFPVRQMLRLLSQSISRNIERLSYAQRLHTRKLINTMVSDRHPTGYIVSNADDLLGLFDADFGILVIGEGAKILGPNQHGQEILIIAEYLRLKQFDTIQASQAVTNDFPDLQLTTGLEIIAGLLYVPLSSGGKDFIAFLRKGQPRHVHWAGKPYKDGADTRATLEPRKSFRIWSETVAGRCRAWIDEQLETAGVLALVYGKFIEVWRQKENALQTTKLTSLLLSNASHEGRTPLNHIINYLEMALNGPLDAETRDNLSRSHAASKSLLFTINDLLDLTRLESGNETSFNERFDLHFAIGEATHLYKKEAERRGILFRLELQGSPRSVIGDAKKIRTVVQNLTANSLKYTSNGSITVFCTTFGEPEGLRTLSQTAVEIAVTDTGCGIPPDKLEYIFKEFEQVESLEPAANKESGVGLGLAVVARIVGQLGGQLRVNSKVDEGSSFAFLIPLALATEGHSRRGSISSHQSDIPIKPFRKHAQRVSSATRSNEIENLVEALASNHMSGPSPKILSLSTSRRQPKSKGSDQLPTGKSPPSAPKDSVRDATNLRILVVEDNDINRKILAKRLRTDGHIVVDTTNGQEGLNTIESDRSFDIVLMDIQMPILNGFEATQEIRKIEKVHRNHIPPVEQRLSYELNGRIPIFAVSASLLERQRDELIDYGMDGWILKPIDFRRLSAILKGVTDRTQREHDVYRPGNWEIGGWFTF
ncbi:Tco3, phytochrome related signal transduction histidine kinase, partial [Collybia nuda]